MSHGEFCHRHEPVRCPLCNAPTLLMDKSGQHGFGHCVIGMGAYKALDDRIKRAINILDIASGDTDPEVIDYSEYPMIHAMQVLLGVE